MLQTARRLLDGCAGGHGPTVFSDTFKRLPGKIDPIETGILTLKHGHQAQALSVVFEAPKGFHHPVKRALARVPKR